MNETALLKVEKREITNSRANRRLRNSGYLPGTIFGKGEEPITIQVKTDQFQKVLAKFGRSTVFKLQLEKKEINAMVKELQMEAFNNDYINVSFQKVSLLEEIKANVGINLVGTESLIAKRLRYAQQVDVLAVKGLPQDIPNAITIDVSSMDAGDNLMVGEVELPKGIELDVDTDQLILSVSHPRIAEEATSEEETSEGEEETTEEE